MRGIRKTEKATIRILSLGLLLIVFLITAHTVWAQKFPARPVNLIVNYAPGGTIDNQAKILGDKLGEVLGQPFIRVHKPGGGGTLGASFVARAKPD